MDQRTIEEISPIETLVHPKHRRNDAKLMDRVGQPTHISHKYDDPADRW
jgi:hypothetical protein